MSITTPFFEKRGVKARVSRITKLTHQAVSKWDGVVPDGRVLEVCYGFDWAVTPHELRPDIYPHPDDGLPEHLRGKSKGEAA